MPKHIAGETLYTVPELQELLGLSDRSIRKYFREGRLKGRKIGRSWHITEKALQDFLGGTGAPADEQRNQLYFHKVRVTEVENSTGVPQNEQRGLLDE